MIFPYFLLDFTNKEENISTNFFKIESFIYKPNSISNFQHILTSDNFKTYKEYNLILLKVFSTLDMKVPACYNRGILALTYDEC